MRIAVLGAGVIGVTSAWYLSRTGHEVTVIERQPGPALETSFANGGQISVSHAEPWANPRALVQILRWLGREDAPLKFRPRADSAQWLWGARFLLECLPWRTRRNTEAILALARYSREKLIALRAETGLKYDGLSRGILQIFTERSDFEAARRKAALLAAGGLTLELKTPEDCLALEPALADSRRPLAGGLYCPEDESGDARKFTQGLAALAAGGGVRFLYDKKITALEAVGERIVAVRIEGDKGEEKLEADAFVVCLGSYSPLLLKPLGEWLPVYPVKGYSVTLPVGNSRHAPTVSLTDEARKLVFSRLGSRLRVAGTAELAGYDTTLNRARCEAILDRAFELFPRAGERSQAELWAGLRPATPGNVPVIGRSRHYRNLYLNTGHGTLGWTLACGSARVLADILDGKRPAISFPFRLPG